MAASSRADWNLNQDYIYEKLLENPKTKIELDDFLQTPPETNEHQVHDFVLPDGQIVYALQNHSAPLHFYASDKSRDEAREGYDCDEVDLAIKKCYAEVHLQGVGSSCILDHTIRVKKYGENLSTEIHVVYLKLPNSEEFSYYYHQERELVDEFVNRITDLNS